MLPKQLHIDKYKLGLIEGKVPAISNNFVKADGGLWTSSFSKEGGSEWVQWCLKNDFFSKGEVVDSYILTPSYDAKIMVIDTLADLLIAYEKYTDSTSAYAGIGMKILDFEKVSKDYDAVHLTERGQWETRLSTPNLYGWDVESTHWFRWKFTDVEKIELKF